MRDAAETLDLRPNPAILIGAGGALALVSAAFLPWPFAIASTVLARALGEGGYSDEELVGILYLLGRAAQAQKHFEEALGYYQRVCVVNIEFRDVIERIKEVERVGR